MGHHFPRTETDVRHLVEHNLMREPRRGELDVSELRAEIEQLRTLVIQLSRIVARNALDRK
jgi:hypothetical protein